MRNETMKQITYLLFWQDEGMAAADTCRQQGFRRGDVFYLENKRVNLGVSERRKLRQLRNESACLKRLVARLT